MSLQRNFLSRRIKDIPLLFSSSRSLTELRNHPDRNGFYASFMNDDDDVDDDARNRNDLEGGEMEKESESESESPWSSLLPELLEQIIQRVEATEDNWPHRQSVVACGCVCKQWRIVTKEVVVKAAATATAAVVVASSSSSQIGYSSASKITFPSCLKKPGPRDSPVKCLIRRDQKNAMFYLYLSLSPSFTDKGKFLLAARRFRNGTHTEYIMSLDATDFSQGSNAYVGKLRSDFLGTKFTIYDSQAPYDGAKASSSRASRRFTSKQISPQVPASNFKIGNVSYNFNLLKSRGPRMMVCSLKSPWPGEPVNYLKDDLNVNTLHSDVSGYSILRNKTPRWHEHLQCWCLNFHGRVTVASVKNFQLVATVDQSQPGAKGDEETVLLQFGKVGNDVFTMDFRQPLSPFQAFAICLTSFGTKLGCE